MISLPKDFGGQGLKHITLYANYLVAKGIWRIIQDRVLWAQVVKQNDIQPLSIEEWIILPQKSFRNIFVMWKYFLQDFHVISHWVV